MGKKIDIIIISGLSGSGKSTALRTLEDIGFYCVDNLPILLLPMFVELCESSSFDIARAALVIDVRERNFLKDFPATLEKLRESGHNPTLVFLECQDDILVKRFQETRRHHPLSSGGMVLDGIKSEREQLKRIKSLADSIVDTSGWNVHELKSSIEDYFATVSRRDMALSFMSFGFKFGLPYEADLVFDVRFLPNPYFVPELKALNGTDNRVAEYVTERPEAAKFFDKLLDFLSFQLPLFEREGKSYLTVAIGCTGGRHRSVAVASRLKDFFQQHRSAVTLHHRDIDKE